MSSCNNRWKRRSGRRRVSSGIRGQSPLSLFQVRNVGEVAGTLAVARGWPGLCRSLSVWDIFTLAQAGARNGQAARRPAGSVVPQGCGQGGPGMDKTARLRFLHVEDDKAHAELI